MHAYIHTFINTTHTHTHTQWAVSTEDPRMRKVMGKQGLPRQLCMLRADAIDYRTHSFEQVYMCVYTYIHCTRFTCFTGTYVQILTLQNTFFRAGLLPAVARGGARVHDGYSVCLLYWYKSTDSDAAHPQTSGGKTPSPRTSTTYTLRRCADVC